MKQEKKKSEKKVEELENEDEILIKFDEFEDVYSKLLPELKKSSSQDGNQVFKVVINLNPDEEEDHNLEDDNELTFSEEFGYY